MPPQLSNNMEDVDLKDDGDDDNLKKEETPASSPAPTTGKSSCFSDERGNLRFVNMVVKRPNLCFGLILGICLLINFVLFRLVFQQGNPFSNPENQFDMEDVRSLQYDSLRLARDEVRAKRENAADDESTTNGTTTTTTVEYQSKNGDVIYWVFEGELEGKGVFYDENSIGAMKEALDLFLKDEKYPEYCQKEDGECLKPLTALNMYYASEWDSALVQETMMAFEDDDDDVDESDSSTSTTTVSKIDLFNMLALCLVQPSTCENVLRPLQCSVDEIEILKGCIRNQDITCLSNLPNLQCLTLNQLLWANETNTNLATITGSWDGSSDTIVGNLTEATEFASLLLQIPLYKFQIDLAYDSNFSPDNLVSMFSRAIILFGSPLQAADEKKKKAEDEEEAAEADREVLKDYIKDEFLTEMDELAKPETHKELNSYYFMGALILDVLLEIVQRDGMLAIFSLVFVFIWLRIHVHSWFLATVGIMEIFFSIPVAWFFFTVVLQVKYFAFLNSLSIFIVAAIGADDIFIFMDAYQQSALKREWPDLETRLSWVYRRTGTAMLITSATTCTAFLCTLITPLVQIQSFGIFAALTIFIDYVLVMTLFCTSVVIYHNKFETRGLCGGGCWRKNLEVDPTAQAGEKVRSSSGGGGDGEELKSDAVSEFFTNRIAPFILKQSNRIFLLIIFAVWIGVAIYQTTLIEPTRESEQFLDENHPLQKSFSILGSEFPTADDDIGLQVHYAWGLGPVDRTGVQLLFDPENFGTPTYLLDDDDDDDNNNNNNDTTTTTTTKWDSTCQEGLLQVCEEFQTLSEYSELIKRKNALGTVYCVWEELFPYYVNQTQELGLTGNEYCQFVNTKAWKEVEGGYIIPEEELDTVIANFLEDNPRSCVQQGEFVGSRYGTELGFDGTTLRYATISVESAVLDPFSRKPEAVARAEYDQFVTIQNDLSERNLCQTEPVVMTDLNEIFIFMNNQAIYVKTAVQSSLLGVGIAFAVLWISTCKFHLALLASLSIASVLVSVTGTMVLIGWTLGSIESILIGIIAGFSVDYVVHLAHAYKTASGNTDERITAAFGDMGISVLNGMITSIGASIPLFFCQLQFFHKFGIFICLTIAFSWIFANFWFMSVVAQLKIPIKDKKQDSSTSNGTSSSSAPAVAVAEEKEVVVPETTTTTDKPTPNEKAKEIEYDNYFHNDPSKSDNEDVSC